jgi:hypothetical protein
MNKSGQILDDEISSRTNSVQRDRKGEFFPSSIPWFFEALLGNATRQIMEELELERDLSGKT